MAVKIEYKNNKKSNAINESNILISLKNIDKIS